MSIGEFKRLLLLMKNEPFFLEKDLKNDDKLSTLLQAADEPGQVKVFYNLLNWSTKVSAFYDANHETVMDA